MKKNELIKKVKQLGYTVDEMANSMYIKDENRIYVHISKNRYYQIKTMNNLHDLPNSEVKEIMDLAVSYASTPIEDRHNNEAIAIEESLYYLVLPKASSKSASYLNYDTVNNSYIFSNKDEFGSLKTKFTSGEIEVLPNQEFIQTLDIERVKS